MSGAEGEEEVEEAVRMREPRKHDQSRTSTRSVPTNSIAFIAGEENVKPPRERYGPPGAATGTVFGAAGR